MVVGRKKVSKKKKVAGDNWNGKGEARIYKCVFGAYMWYNNHKRLLSHCGRQEHINMFFPRRLCDIIFLVNQLRDVKLNLIVKRIRST